MASPVSNGGGLPTIEKSQDYGTTGTHSDKHDDAYSNDISSQSGTEDGISSNAQAGVQAVQATATVWGKKHLIAAYVMIWMIYFITSIQEVVVRALTPYVTSSFSLHSLTAATNIISSIIGGLTKIPIAKILDTWGRPQGLALCLHFWVVGLIMMAGCNNVETFAAAQVFSAVGAQGVSYCLTVFIADTSSLKNRSLMLAFATSPYIVTTWIGGPMSDAILAGPGFRWGFGIFTIIVPVVVAPLCILFFWGQRKALKLGVIQPSNKRLTLGSVKRYAISVDLAGILILATGMALFLLSFSLYSYQRDQWRSPLIISFIVIGGLLIIAFAFYEKYLAPVTFIPYSLLLDRSVFFGGMMFVFVFASSGLWGSYLYSALLVVWSQSVTTATYISSIYRVASCGWALVVGVAIRLSGRFKWVALYFALPLQILGVALDIYFRQPGKSVGFIIMTQIFIAFAGGSLVICGEMAMMAPSDHQHIAVVLAILNLFSSIGSAIGSTISTAIWTGTFKEALIRHLPADAPIDTIYGSIVAQTSYPVGSDIRNGINLSYYDAQKYQLVAATVLLVAGWACVLFWKDIRIKDIKQVKGTVV